MPRSEPAPIEPNPQSKPGRFEWTLVLVLVLFGLGFRLAFPRRMAVEHFDEGVYASNIWFDKDAGFRYPARHLYAPPLVPWFLECSQIALGSTNWGTMLPGILCGTLTVILLWHFVRKWFGIPAGMAALAIATFSDFHILYSRTALTEPVLCLFLLASVFWLLKALSQGDFRWAIVAGFATGLAWSAKYNGWLPTVIGTAGLAAWSIRRDESNPTRSRRFAALAVAIVSAWITFYPVWSGLQDFGGYRAVQENHARYLTGLSGWAAAAHRQLATHAYFDGPLSWISLGLAVAGPGILSMTGNRRPSGVEIGWTIGVALFIAGLGAGLGTSVVLALLSLAWLIVACPWRQKSGNSETELAYWLIAAWFVGLLLTTPLYTPYPRLSLPWLISAWIAAAALIGRPFSQQFIRGRHDWQQGRLAVIGLIVLTATSMAAIGFQVSTSPQLEPRAWENRADLARAVARASERVKKGFGERVAVLVYAEPALFYHLRADGLAAAPIADVQFTFKPSQEPILLAIGPHARRSESFQKDWQRAKHQFELVEEFPYQASSLVLLNHYTPADLSDPNFSRRQAIQLYRFKAP